MKISAFLTVTLALCPTLALGDGKAVTDLVSRFSMIKICGIYDWVSIDPTSQALLDALDLKIRAQKAQLDPDVFSAALNASRNITNKKTDSGRNAKSYAAVNCTSILADEAAAFRADN